MLNKILEVPFEGPNNAGWRTPDYYEKNSVLLLRDLCRDWLA